MATNALSPAMDGITTTLEIRQIDNYQPTIVAMTANVFKEDQIKCKEAGMNAFLSKPLKKKIR
ncbi:response regulator [Bacteriovorax sp. Seq25_V]|uniref:response regulator n=1 Tax=Bacteriovorax sp. Seq25_V TaxID=1201288 RepID=UPI0012F8AD63|nr:response regulator [Bacteriovorax sp. Seq25_V]